jgi:hypothetical protein
MNLLETIENIPGCDIFDIFDSSGFEFIKEGTQYVVTHKCDHYTISSRYTDMKVFDTPDALLNYIETNI